MKVKYLLLASLCAAFLVNCHGSATWVKLNSSPVCFGAEEGTHGEFTPGKNANVWAFKLVHRSGYVTCNVNGGSSSMTNWGCGPNADPKEIYTFLITQDGALSNPHFSIRVADYKYLLPGYDSSSSYLIFFVGDRPFQMSSNTELELWYGEDLYNQHLHDNGGTACVDVYGLM